MNNYRILLVEDNMEISEMLRRGLKGGNYHLRKQFFQVG